MAAVVLGQLASAVLPGPLLCGMDDFLTMGWDPSTGAGQDDERIADDGYDVLDSTMSPIRMSGRGRSRSERR